MTSVSLALLARMVASTTVVHASSSGRAALNKLQHRHAGASFISSLQFTHKLRVCNAYPYAYPIDVYLGKEKLTITPLAYKACEEFAPPMKAGDKLDFKVGDSSAGSFSVSELPSNDAVLVLVIYRHDTLSTAVSFESHVFGNILNSQIAVLDAYRGATSSQATPFIQDVSDAKAARKEELRYDSVVAVNRGLYEVVLASQVDGEEKAKQQLVALNRESYVVIRCGIETQQGQSYPQDLMVFPKSDPKALTGAAMAKYALLAVVLPIAAAVHAALQ
jgi:hypothetical protein